MRYLTIALLLVFTQAVSSQQFRTLCSDGIKHIADRHYDKAAECFRKATELGSTDQERTYAFANLAYSQHMCGDLHKALKSYNSAIGDDTGKIALMLQRANILVQIDSLDKALEDYNNILKKEPTNSSALFFRACIYSEINEFSKAKADYMKLLSIEPENNNVKLGLAMLYKKEGKYNESLTLLTLLIESSPQTAEYYIARSDVERLMGQLEIALMDVEKAIELEPENVNHHTLQGILYEELGRTSAARKSRIEVARLKNVKNGEKE